MDDGQMMAMAMRLAANGMLSDRLGVMGRLGQQFNGARDVYDAAGYAKVLCYEDYRSRYERQDIAGRIVNAPANETWRLSPEVLDGADPKSASVNSDFCRAWQRIATAADVDVDNNGSLDLLHYLHRVDVLSGIGRYGILLLGLRDGLPLSEPVAAGSLSGPEDLLYAMAFDEGGAQIGRLVNDTSSPRYGLPETYKLTMSTASAEGALLKTVHWSRVIHVAERLTNDEIFGTPRLQRSWNRLVDLEKVMAASGEAAWRLSDPGYMLTTEPGRKLPTNPDDLEEIEEQMDEFVHKLRRFFMGSGLVAHEFRGEMSDPTGLVNINIALISADTEIPQRILLGSERGELASGQDERTWKEVVAARQQQFAGPMILRRTINRLIWAGVLPSPESGAFSLRWPALSSQNRSDMADAALKMAEALTTLGMQVEPDAFVAAFGGLLPPGTVTLSAVTPVTTPAAMRGEDAGGQRPFARTPDALTQPAAGGKTIGNQAGLSTNQMVLQLDPDDDEAEDKEKRQAEERHISAIERALQEQLAHVLAAGDLPARLEEAVASLPSESLNEAATRLLNDAAGAGVRLAGNTLLQAGIDVTWSLPNLAAQRWVRGYVFDLVREINETTVEQLRTALAAWVERGGTLDELVDALTSGTTFSRERAELIASTEATRAYQAGSLEMYRASGVVEEIEWCTAVDERVCDECGPMEGRRAGLNGIFPGEKTIPAHPRCRCWSRPVVHL